MDISVRGTAAVPSILGKVTLNDGSATFNDTLYQLQRGTIYFNNPIRIDPIVDIDATARVENYNGQEPQAHLPLRAAALPGRRL